MSALSAEHRAVIELTYIPGYSCRDVAQVMDCPVDTVKTRMFYARRRLKSLLGLSGRRRMSGRVLRFEGSVHNQAMRLLPWYVNGTLLAEELGLVRQHVAGCSECRREVDELRQLQDICMRVEGRTDAPASFARLKRRLQHDHAGPASRWDRLAQQLDAGADVVSGDAGDPVVRYCSLWAAC
jgi:hypothetical protein